MIATVVPTGLPDVLPTERLTASGMPVPAVREELRRIPNGRNVLNVASVWLQTFGLLALVCWLTVRLPLVLALPIWAVTFVLDGSRFRACSPSSATRPPTGCCSPRSGGNDSSANGCCRIPAFVPFDAYRRATSPITRTRWARTNPTSTSTTAIPSPPTRCAASCNATRRQLRLEEPEGPARRPHQRPTAEPSPCGSSSPR